MGTVFKLLLLGLVLGSCAGLPKILYDGLVEAQCLETENGRRGRSLPQITITNRLSRHHIIPVSRLRSFFNTALQRNNQDNYELSLLISLIGQLSQDGINFYLAHNSRVNSAIVNDLTVARNIPVNYTYGFGDPPIERLFDVTTIIQNLFLWMPANIFWGPDPELRNDDPGEHFETNANRIIDNRNYNILTHVNAMMVEYIAYDNRAIFYQIITELQALADRQHRPYDFQWNQWVVTTYNGRDTYHINVGRKRRSVSAMIKLRRFERSLAQLDDPFCLRPLEALKLHLQDKNLVIAAAVVERVRKGSGFRHSNYASWKEYYANSCWSGLWHTGIYWNGRFKAGKGSYQAFGQVYNDGSFAVGVTGKDTKIGNDNWVTEMGGDWDVENKNGYYGEMYFDKNGRPVALAITSNLYAGLGSGWSFVYNNGRWEYESKDDWDKRRFNGITESLDSKAPVFLIKRP